MSILSGYPIGSQIIGDLYSKGLITQNEAKKMALFCTTSGPIFVIGAVGVGMLNNFKIGVIIYISHIISSIILGIIGKFIYKSQKFETHKNQDFFKTHTDRNIISKCLNQTISSIMMVGGYITIFYLLSELLTNLKVFSLLSQLLSPTLKFFNLNPSLSEGILFGIVEITRGCKTLSATNSSIVIPLIAGLISFSGISIIMQSMSFLKDTKIKTHHFIFSKVVHCFLAILICQLILIII